jgi:hypothetical protein
MGKEHLYHLIWPLYNSSCWSNWSIPYDQLEGLAGVYPVDETMLKTGFNKLYSPCASGVNFLNEFNCESSFNSSKVSKSQRGS